VEGYGSAGFRESGKADCPEAVAQSMGNEYIRDILIEEDCWVTRRILPPVIADQVGEMVIDMLADSEGKVKIPAGGGGADPFQVGADRCQNTCEPFYRAQMEAVTQDGEGLPEGAVKAVQPEMIDSQALQGGFILVSHFP